MTALRQFLINVRRKQPFSPQKMYMRKLRRQGGVCFIHINKCGGTTIEKALKLPKIHDTALARIDAIGRDTWDANPSFALIRHPYEKVISHYKYRIKTNQTSMARNTLDLNDWIAEAYGAKNPDFYDKPVMFAPCLHWVADRDGTILVDEILKLEEIGQVWPAFSKRVFGREVPLQKENSTSQKLTRGDLTSASLEILNAHFAPDFEAFGYSPAP